MNPFIKYYDRYQKIEKEISAKLSADEFATLIETDTAQFNNLFMAGLGMSTLFLRMGAVIQMSQKFHDGDANNDSLFMKQVMDNLRETLPSDSNWKNLWYAAMKTDSKWEKALPKDNNKNTLLDRFVSFRNKYVHQYISLVPVHEKELKNGLDILEQMSQLYSLFEGGNIIEEEDQYYWFQNNETCALHPFIQKGAQEGLPYLFQGLYENKTKAKFINTIFGDETQPAENIPLAEKFQPMQLALRGGAGQIFDHSERLQYYLQCFVGREREVNAIFEWVKSDSGKNILPIYSEAGMGKGALTAAVIELLKLENIIMAI